MAAGINDKLAACKSAGDVADVFEEAKPMQNDSIRYLASVIEKAINGNTK
jgi:hypothetical protein